MGHFSQILTFVRFNWNHEVDNFCLCLVSRINLTAIWKCNFLTLKSLEYRASEFEGSNISDFKTWTIQLRLVFSKSTLCHYEIVICSPAKLIWICWISIQSWPVYNHHQEGVRYANQVWGRCQVHWHYLSWQRTWNAQVWKIIHKWKWSENAHKE